MRKLINVLVILLGVFSIGFAGVLDTIDTAQKNNIFVPHTDVKINNIALAGNPAVIAVNKQNRVGLAGTFYSKDVYGNNNIYSNSFYGDAGFGSIYYSDNETEYNSTIRNNLDFHFITSYAENWLALNYNVINNSKRTIYTGTLTTYGPMLTSSNRSSSYNGYSKEQIETIALTWARDLDWFTIGIRAALITEKEKIRETTIYTNPPYINGYNAGDECHIWTNTDPYWSWTLGLEKDIADNQKLLLAHNFGAVRNKKWKEVERYTGTPYREYTIKEYGYRLPDTTALGYVYKMNNNLELAGAYTVVWGAEYERIEKYDNDNRYRYVIKEERAPYSIYGVAVSWQAIDDLLELQGYVNTAQGINDGTIRYEGDEEVKTDIINYTQLGGSVILSLFENHNIALSILQKNIRVSFEEGDDLPWTAQTVELAYSYKF